MSVYASLWSPRHKANTHRSILCPNVFCGLCHETYYEHEDDEHEHDEHEDEEHEDDEHEHDDHAQTQTACASNNQPPKPWRNRPRKPHDSQ